MPRELKISVVPEHWKAPMGPYRQAPDAHGGEWWLVTPFSDPNPWLKGTRPPETPALPDGFEKLFGNRPEWQDFRYLGKSALMSFETAKVHWDQELKYFKRVGVPPGYTPDEIGDSIGLMTAWGPGQPTFYEGRFGWMGRFLESDIADYDSSAFQIIKYPHHTVSQFQIANFTRNGVVPAKWHPFVPPRIFDRSED